jgi:hypothetical protein
VIINNEFTIFYPIDYVWIQITELVWRLCTTWPVALFKQMYCSYYSGARLLQPSPLKKSRPEIMKEERSLENKKRQVDYSFGLSSTKVGVITLLIPRSGTCLLSVENMQTETSFNVGSALTSTTQQNGWKISVRRETTMTMINDNQDSMSALGQS